MKRELHIGRPHYDRSGNVGSVVRVTMKTEGKGSWSSDYRISTHGKTDEQIEAEIERVTVQHGKREKRMNSFAEKAKKPLRIRGREYRFNVLTITMRGSDFELQVSVKDENGKRAPGMPLRWVKSSVDSFPTDGEIEAIVRSTIESRIEEQTQHQSRLLGIAAKLQRGE
jgi:hypothetical protein